MSARKISGQMLNAGGIPLYIPNTCGNIKPHHHVSLNTHCMADYGVPTTTAVVIKQNWNGKLWGETYLILKGDHFENLNNLDLLGCLEYFSKNIQMKARHSEDIIDFILYEPMFKPEFTKAKV